MTTEFKMPLKGSKKQLKELISYKLELTFQDLKEMTGKKKYLNKIKKATKVLASGAGKKFVGAYNTTTVEIV